MIVSNHASEACTLLRRTTCSLWRLISSSKKLRIIPKIIANTSSLGNSHDVRVLREYWTFGRQLPRNPRRSIVSHWQQWVSSTRRSGLNQPRPYYQGGNGNSNSFNPNQPTLRDLVYSQAKIIESLQKKLAAMDKSMETIHAKMDGFSTAMKN